MSFVARMDKVKRQGLAGMRNHVIRKGNQGQASNPDIDPERTQFNYSLVDHDPVDMLNRMKGRLDYLHLKPRKDAVLLTDWVISASHEEMEKLTPDQQKEYFERVKNLFAKQYGEENIMYAMVHMDETTPHMHLGLMPITMASLSCKDLFDRFELRNVQNEVEKIAKDYGIGGREPASKRKHVDTARWKAEQVGKTLQETKNAVQELLRTKEGISKEIKELDRQMKDMDKQVRKAEAELSEKSTQLDRINNKLEELGNAEALKVTEKIIPALNKIEKMLASPNQKSLWRTVTNKWAKAQGFELVEMKKQEIGASKIHAAETPVREFTR